ncbi:MAG: bifunctional DNA-binding transcriptional regulator/O6-methylguanine-DNA methyltransferase Ada [Candidatus Solibacter usitatus]|nr:bifunctional DNA-binding transcriptional regulator/O6-methylguanine-DNA methyltransferase Ada [Candidatus Solibacter usitatus]
MQTSQVLMDEVRWQAVLAHEICANEGFVYAVRSTGIFCRPWCSSRRPKRENVEFFPAPQAAEKAGYRACRRCRPLQARPHNPQLDLIRRVCRSIEGHPDSPPKLAALGKETATSVFHLQRTFKRFLGITPRQYADALRVERLKSSLREGTEVTPALYDAGYGSSSRLYESAPRQLGMTPATYKRGGEGMRIAYTTVVSPLGRLLVAGTERGICAVSLGDRDDKLTAALHEEYPRAEIQREDLRLRQWVTALVSHLQGETPHLDLPLDVQATAFEWRVWQELRKVPFGATRTYTEIAKALGRPRAVRAVANACAANPAAIVIPCHRAVRKDGSTGGYRWGVERKKLLLEREARVS